MKRLFAVSFFLIALCLFFPLTIYAEENTVYVDQTFQGDDGNGSASAPFKTLTKALDSRGGDDDLTIILNNRYAFSAEDLTFEAPLKDDGTGTPRVTIQPALSGYFVLDADENAYVTFKNIQFDGGQDKHRVNPCMIVSKGTLILDNTHIRDFDSSTLAGAFARIDGGALQMQNGCTANACKSQNGVFNIGDNGAMTITGALHLISFADCHAAGGGVIYNKGSLIVDHALFQDNDASQEGGAIFNRGIAAIRNTRFNRNSSAAINNDSSCEGGAIYNEASTAVKESKIELSQCRFENNSSVGYGGAISNHGTFNGIGLTFESNTAPKGSAIYAALNRDMQNNINRSIVTLNDCLTAKDQSILTNTNKFTFCGGTYQGPIQLDTDVICVTVKKSESSQNTKIFDLRLDNGQYINYSGGFTKDCRVDFSKPEEFLSTSELIVQGTFESPDLINTFHLKNDNYRLAFENSESNKSLKAVPKDKNQTTPQPSIHYAEETAGVDADMEWKASGEGSGWQPCRIDMPLGEFGWDGSNEVDISVRYAATSALKPSAETALSIPARPAAPTGFSATDETSYGAGDGSIAGVSDKMQYRVIGDDESAGNPWIDVSANEHFDLSSGRLGRLAPGSYQLRIKAGESSFASPPGEILEIKAGAKPVEPAVKPLPDLKKQINYTDEIITVTKGTRYRAADGKWLPCEDNMPLEAFGWDGSAEVTVAFRDQDGRKNTLTIPPRAAIEDGTLNAVDETVYGQGGEITGVRENMEYRPLSDITTESEGESWIDCAASPHFDKAAGALKNMPAGDYAFRTKASGDAFAGAPVTLTVQAAERPVPKLAYQVHGKYYGWSQGEKSAGETAGTTGLCLRAEAFRLRLGEGQAPYQNAGVSYRVHMADIGWSDLAKDGEIAGTIGESRRIEALEATLTGDEARHFDLWYRVHVKDIGWMPWVKNGETAGTTGQARRVEAVEMQVLLPGETPAAADGSMLSWLANGVSLTAKFHF